MALNPIPPQAYTKDTLQKAYSWLLSQGPEIKEMASTQDILVSLYLQATRNGAESLERPSIQNFRTELKTLADQLGNFDTGKKSAAPKNSKTTGNHRQSDYVTENGSAPAKTTSAYSNEMPGVPPGITSEQLKQVLAAVYESSLSSNSSTAPSLPPVVPTSGQQMQNKTTPVKSQPQSASAQPSAFLHAGTPHSSTTTSVQKAPNAVPPLKEGLKEELKQGTAISEKIVEDSVFVTPQFEIAGLDTESLRKITEIQSALNLSTHHEAIRALIAIGYKKLKLGLD